MIATTLKDFRAIWCVDFEFSSPSGEPPRPVCCVAHEINTRRTVHLWEDDLLSYDTAPYGINEECLMVAYYASAEVGCHLALNWPLPQYILDLYTEFRNRTNGLSLTCGSGLVGALIHFGLPYHEKETMRQLALRGGPWSPWERKALLSYCESDVLSLASLLARMEPGLDLARALLRGRYSIAAARIERTGIPIDVPALDELRIHWESIQDRLIASIDADYGVFEGRVFKVDRWQAWLNQQQIDWPRHSSGRLILDDETFRDMTKRYPRILLMQQLRASLAKMRLSELAVGRDRRNRCLLSVFRAKTGRNQPSTTQFVFGPAVWIRGLIRPDPGHALAYIDWSQQEFGIAAYLSGDRAMMEAYETGDPYFAFAKQARAVPHDATKQSHGAVREQFKSCALGVLFGMGVKALSARIGRSESHAWELLNLHRETYPDFWRWSDAAVDYAMLVGSLHTVFGWTIQLGERTTARTLRNFPMQGNGAEMLRLACCLTTEQGVHVCAPVHDALLIEAPVDEIRHTVATVQQLMAQASSLVLGGHHLRSEATIVLHPDRYCDERGIQMWATVWEHVGELKASHLNESCSVTATTM